MPIDSFKPELAKRRTTFQIAKAQLEDCLKPIKKANGAELRERMDAADVAMKDYKEAGFSLVEWLEQRPDEDIKEHEETWDFRL